MKNDIKILLLSIFIVILVGLHVSAHVKISNLQSSAAGTAHALSLKIDKLENEIKQNSDKQTFKELFKKFFNTFKDYIK